GLCNLPAPAWIEGTDYSARRLAGKTPANEPDSAFLQLVVSTGHGDATDRPWRGVVTRDGWKYICLENQPWVMFNLREDPYELVNCAHNVVYAARRRELQAKLQNWIEKTGDAFPLATLAK